MSKTIEAGNLKIDAALFALVGDEIAPGTGVDAAEFWQALATIVEELGPENEALLRKRDDLQAQLDAWHRERKGQTIDIAEYRQFLLDIGYVWRERKVY